MSGSDLANQQIAEILTGWAEPSKASLWLFLFHCRRSGPGISLAAIAGRADAVSMNIREAATLSDILLYEHGTEVRG